jgi:hypothetical protein
MIAMLERKKVKLKGVNTSWSRPTRERIVSGFEERLMCEARNLYQYVAAGPKIAVQCPRCLVSNLVRWNFWEGGSAREKEETYHHRRVPCDLFV